jgi:hypothetical protein
MMPPRVFLRRALRRSTASVSGVTRTKSATVFFAGRPILRDGILVFMVEVFWTGSFFLYDIKKECRVFPPRFASYSSPNLPLTVFDIKKAAMTPLTAMTKGRDCQMS